MAKKTVVKKKTDKKVEKSKKPAAKSAAPAKKPVAVKKAAAKGAVKKATVAKKPAKVAKPILKKPLKTLGKVAAKVLDKIAPKKAAEKVVAEKPTMLAKAKPASEKPAKKEKVEKVAKAKVAPEAPPEEVLEAAGEGDEEVSDEVVLTDAEGRRYCRVKDCDQLASVDGYCRYHYLLYWKKIQIRKKILTEGKLERYIEELTARYPDKFLDMLRKDLRSDKEFLAAIAELEIDESAAENEFEDEAQTYIDEVRGMGEPAARDEEDF